MGKGKREEQERGQEAGRARREPRKKAQACGDKENIKENAPNLNFCYKSTKCHIVATRLINRRSGN